MKKFYSILLFFILLTSNIYSQTGWFPTSTSTDAPSPRSNHGAVWTGSKMLIWGGFDGGTASLGDGKIYNPVTNSWTNMSPFNAPSPRRQFSTVWTGSKMIIWGGVSNSTYLNTGGVYDVATDTWTPITTALAPSGRKQASTIWTGTYMIIWGGNNDVVSVNTGAMYDPANDSWTPMSLTNAPTARSSHSAIWAGSPVNKMIIWGGNTNATNNFNTGGIFNPATNSWEMATSINGTTPSARASHSAVWTGTKMIVWGGSNNNTFYNTGAIYNPLTNIWESTTSLGPGIRSAHTAIWSGTYMFIWGGYDGTTAINTGSAYNPATNSWNPLPIVNAPSARIYHTAVWANSKMIIWGGSNENGVNWTNTGGFYETLVGINQNQNFSPEKYSLSQNYPNPFNPSTKIRYEIPKESSVTLIIYNTLGKEVSNLNNSKLSAGIYETEWDATNFPSGIYYYMLKTESFSDTKKMILIK